MNTNSLTTVDYGQYTQWIYPYTSPYAQYIEVVKEPATCVGKAHVFACDHEPKCLCGKIQRVMPAPEKATKCRGRD